MCDIKTYHKMFNCINVYYFLFIFLCVTSIHAEDEEENVSGEDDTKSTESETREDFNRNLKAKLLQLAFKELKNMTTEENIDNTQPCASATTRSNNFNSYSYTVSIQRKGSHYASGALIDKKWILTAAGPFYNLLESTKLLKARIGSVNNKKGGVFVPIKEIVIHPWYINMRPSNDLALLRIASPVTVTDDHILPIPISSAKGQILNAKFQTAYWSRLIVNNKLLSNTAKERVKQNNLRVSIQKVISRKNCVETLEKYNCTCGRTVVCLEPIVLRHTPCLPDVGAPVTLNQQLWGITSGWVSEDCSEDMSPTVFNRVSLPVTRDWIESTIQDMDN